MLLCTTSTVKITSTSTHKSLNKLMLFMEILMNTFIRQRQKTEKLCTADDKIQAK